MNIEFGIELDTDTKAYKKAHLVTRLSGNLETYLETRNYGSGVYELLIRFICQEEVPGSEAFQKVRKPRFVDVEEIELIGGGTEKVYKLFSYDMKMNGDTYNAYVSSPDQMSLMLLAQEIINSLVNIDKLPKRVRDFDREKFKADVRYYLEKNVLVGSE